MRFIADLRKPWAELLWTITIAERALFPLAYLLVQIVIFGDLFFRKKSFITLIVLLYIYTYILFGDCSAFLTCCRYNASSYVQEVTRRVETGTLSS